MFLIQGLRVLNSNYITQSKNSSDVIIIKPGRIRYLFVGPSKKRKPTNSSSELIFRRHGPSNQEHQGEPNVSFSVQTTGVLC